MILSIPLVNTKQKMLAKYINTERSFIKRLGYWYVETKSRYIRYVIFSRDDVERELKLAKRLSRERCICVNERIDIRIITKKNWIKL